MGLEVSKRRRGPLGLVALALAGLSLTPQAASGDRQAERPPWVADFIGTPIPTAASPVSKASLSSESTAVLGSKKQIKVDQAETDLSSSRYDIVIPTPLPPAVGVVAFVNQSGVSSLDWLGVAAGFAAGELLTANRKLRTHFGPLIVEGAQREPMTPESIADFAEENDVRYVVVGSYSRPDWELELHVELWEVVRGTATRMGSTVHRGDFKKVHQFLSTSMASLCNKVGLPFQSEGKKALSREPTSDFYAFTLFGRGLAALLRARNGRDWNDARKNLERGIYIDPAFAENQRVLGELYLRLRELRFRHVRRKTKLDRLALVHFERALRLRPGDEAATIAVASAADRFERPEKARDLLVSILVANPLNFEARYRLGKVLWDIGRAEESYIVLRELVKHRPNDVRARRVLVMIHSARGSGEALVDELEAVAELDASDIQTQMDLGAAYAALDRNQDAIDVYTAIVASHPKKVAALKFLGDLYKKSGSRTQAVKYYGLALAAAPADPRPYFSLGALYVEAGEDDKARRIYQRAQRFRRYAPEVHTNLGGIAFRAGRLADALWHHRRAVASNPRRARYRYNLALALSADGQLDKADSELEMGLRYDANHVALNYLKGVVLLRRGDANAASIQFEKTLELKPDHGDAKHNLALIGELRRRAQEGELVRELPL